MNEQPGALIKTLACGGGVDWRPPRFQNNVRSEIQHMMMVMFLAVKFELPVLYSVDLLHAGRRDSTRAGLDGHVLDSG